MAWWHITSHPRRERTYGASIPLPLSRNGKLASLFSPTTINWTNYIQGLGISLNEAARIPVRSVFPGANNHPHDIRPDHCY